MKAIQITTPNKMQLVEIEKPIPGPGEALIKVAAAGICGTDIHIYRGEYEASYPVIPGHEFSGTITAVGEDVAYFKPGDRVTADPNIPCHRCVFCKRNEPNQCENLTATGVNRPGAFAEYIVMPESNIFPINSLSFEAAALVEPLACVVWGLKRVQIQPGDSVLIFGAGPMGCLMLQAVRSAGAATVVITDRVASRLELAAELGATETILVDDRQDEKLRKLAPYGYDVVADATGLPPVLEQALTCVRPRGKVWVFGVAPPEAQATFVPYDVFRKDLSIIGSFAVNRTFQESINLIQSGAVQVAPLISHCFTLDNFVEAFEQAQYAPERMKIQFEGDLDGLPQ